MAAIRAFVIDDSAVVRRHLAEALAAGGIEVAGSAADPLFAWPKLQADWPDVIVLDVEMPRMDGLSFLRRLMAERPTPVVMCSTLTEKGCETTLQALAAGAVGFVTKPKLGLKTFLEDRGNGLVDAVRAAARANLRAMRAAAPSSAAQPPALQAALPASAALAQTTEHVIAVAVSTGGVQAIETVLAGLDRTTPGLVVVQHMPEKFTGPFAARLAKVTGLDVLEARDGDRVLPGRVLIAPGGRHMLLARSGAQYQVEVRDGPPVNHHRPSCDVLLRSVARVAGRNATGLVMTGMGSDGARGLLEMHEAGARTAAQDEATSVVFGMPAAAIKLGAADAVLPLDGIAGWLRGGR